MTRLLRGLLTAGLVVGWWVGEVEAQVIGLPVAPRATLEGWSLQGTVGLPGDDAGGGGAAALSVATEADVIGFEGTAGAHWPCNGGDDQGGLSLLVSVPVLREARSPFRLAPFGSVGAVIGEAIGLRLLGGLSFGFVIPTPVVSVAPWVAPRVDYVSGLDGGFDGVHAGFAAGIDAAVLQGIGLRAAYDRIFIDGSDATTFAIGLYYSFRPGF